MSITVGEIILASRTIIPDMPMTLPNPPLPVLTPLNAGGELLGDYFISLTGLTPWGGETTIAGEVISNIAVPDNALRIAQPAGTITLGYSSYRVYVGQYAGQPFGYIPVAVNGFPLVLNNLTSLIISVPPPINRAWLPDTDGYKFPATTIYGWLREALKQAADITGGIYDATGVATVSNQASYQLVGEWKRFTHAWHDGFRLALGNRGDIFYRNKITAGFAGMVVSDLKASRTLIEYYPIPSRSAGHALVAAPGVDTSLGTTIGLNASGGFLLKQGLALLGTVADGEIIGYQSYSPAVLSGVIRGLGGTPIKAWPAGTPVTELNGRFAGYRYPHSPQPGDARQELDVPPGWETSIPLYMESRYRETERRFPDAQKLRDTFTAELKGLRSSMKQLLGPRQVGEQYINEVWGSGLGGGWLLP